VRAPESCDRSCIPGPLALLAVHGLPGDAPPPRDVLPAPPEGSVSTSRAAPARSQRRGRCWRHSWRSRTRTPFSSAYADVQVVSTYADESQRHSKPSWLRLVWRIGSPSPDEAIGSWPPVLPPRYADVIVTGSPWAMYAGLTSCPNIILHHSGVCSGNGAANGRRDDQWEWPKPVPTSR
jgi:hypothetical protein